MGPIGIKKRLVFGLAAVVVLLIVDSALSYRNTQQLYDDAHWVVHSRSVILQIDEVSLSVMQAQDGYSSYIATGSDVFLGRYKAALLAEPVRMARLEQMTADNPQQQRRVARLKVLIAAYFEDIQLGIAVAHDQGLAALRTYAAHVEGQQKFDEVDALMNEMTAVEDVLRKQRVGQRDDARWFAVACNLIVTGLGLIMVFAFLRLFERGMRKGERTAAQLHEQRQLLEATLLSIGDAVITTDADACITFMNPIAQKLTGWVAEDAAGQHLEKVFRIINEDSRETVDNPALRALQEGAIVGLTNHTILVGRYGTETPIDDSAAPIRGTSGTISGAVLVFRDITARHKAASELAAANRRNAETLALLDAVVMNAPIGIGLYDNNLRFVKLNDALARINGLPVEEQLGRTITEAIPGVPEEVLADLRQVLDTGEAIAQKEVIRPSLRNPGDAQQLFVDFYPVRGQGGAMLGVGATVLDVTSLKRSEAALRESESKLRRLAAELSEADSRKDEFLATLAHELRNPLAPIRNGLNLMRISGNDRDKFEQAQLLMDRQLTHLVRLVDDLMDISRISRGSIELRREHVDLAEVVSTAIEGSRNLVDKMGHTLTVTLPDHRVVLDADLTRLAQVFSNLLNNAAKYTDVGGRIGLSVRHEGRDVTAIVEDNGIGIPEDKLGGIFEMFSQVDHSLEKSQGGLGIGLTLVRRLVEMHGGTVEAQSGGLGTGSRFIVRLPIAIESTAELPQKPPLKAASSEGLRVLIVDDNRDSADSMAMVLQFMGHTARTAYDGVDGVAAAASFQPHVILMDIGLPRLNGYEACRNIREQPTTAAPPIIVAITGWGQDSDRLRSREAGFNHHLVKPIDPNALAAILAEVKGTALT